MAVQFFYDQQIRRFLLQFIRMVSNFQVEFGTTDPATGSKALQTVPVIYGDQSRQGAHILRGASENAMSSVPAMAVYISQFSYDRDRIQEPFHVSKIHLRQRAIDPDTGLPTNQQGDAYTVERLMPVPYKLSLKLDIWTSNTEQKLQLVEQIATLFNPSLEIQSTDNYIDWTSLSAILLTDVNWDSRTVPMGSDESISIATMTFELPIWISPPAKVKKLGVVQKVISGLWDADGNLSEDAIGDPNKLLGRRSYNLMRYSVLVSGNTIQLYRYDETFIGVNTIDAEIVPNNNVQKDSWKKLLNLYGTLVNGTSEIRLEQPNGTEVVGTVAFHPTDESLLIYNPFIDTLPVNSLPAINAIIDPRKVNVDQLLIDSITGDYKVATGTRFLVLDDINAIDNTDFAKAWTPNGNPLVANANDIIEYTGERWRVIFDSQRNVNEKYVTNANTNIQYRWTGESWIKSYEGIYREGSWTIIL